MTDPKQIVHALERAALRLEYERDLLASQLDYRAEFPGTDAELIRAAIDCINVGIESVETFKRAEIQACTNSAEYYSNDANVFRQLIANFTHANPTR
jgi:hypothetical protein